MLEQDAPTPISDRAQPHPPAVPSPPHHAAIVPSDPTAPNDPNAADAVPAGGAAVDPSTRLILARLASGTSALLPDERPPAAGRSVLSSAFPGARARVGELGSIFFPAVGGAGTRGVGRMELAAFGVALVGATVIGVSLPHPQPVQANPVAIAAAPAAAAPVAPQAPADSGAGADAASSPDTASVDASSTDALTPATVADTGETATPATSEDGAVADDTAAGSTDDAAAADQDDPLGGANAGLLKQVALVVVHGDAPLRWREAPAGSPARLRAAKGTTFTGFGQRPDAPLVTSLGLIAGQASNPAARAGCDGPAPLTPGTIDAKGVVAGSGCDYPAGTPSIPTAVAVDGRSWKAYTPVATADAAKAALCGVGTPDASAQDVSRASALARLSDLSSSGACEAAASPLSALASDLASDNAPAWLVVDIGGCGADGCDNAESAARDKELDATIATLTAAKGLDASSAIFVVGDGTVAGLAAAEPGTVPAAPDDPDAPAAVSSGALLIGQDVEKDKADPLSLDPFAIARAQTSWLGLTPPGAAAEETTTALAVPGA